MRVSDEELAAYADGELEGAEAARVLLAVAASPELMRRVELHRAVRARLAAHFAPTLEQEVPERLAAVIEHAPSAGPMRKARAVEDVGEGAVVVDPQAAGKAPRWRGLLAAVLAAALMLAVLLA